MKIDGHRDRGHGVTKIGAWGHSQYETGNRDTVTKGRDKETHGHKEKGDMGSQREIQFGCSVGKDIQDTFIYCGKREK